MKKTFEQSVRCLLYEVYRRILRNFSNSTTVEYRNQGLFKQGFIETQFADKDGHIQHSSLISLN